MLEIASDSGLHTVNFKRRFPNLNWQSSDISDAYMISILSWIKYYNLEREMPKTLNIDAENFRWDLTQETISELRAIICIKLLHISDWKYTEGLFRNSCTYLDTEYPLIIYGPFKINNKHISQGNKEFDKRLKNENIKWGIRNIEDINILAKRYHFKQCKKVKIPKNNYSLIFKKC